MSKRKLTLFGIIVMILFLMIQIPHWVALETGLDIAGFPDWIWYYIVIHFILISALFWYSQSQEQ